MGKCSADVQIAVQYTGTYPKTMDGAIVKNFVKGKFNAASGIIQAHQARLDMTTLETPEHSVTGSIAPGQYKSFLHAMAAQDFVVRNVPRAGCDCTCN
jgi:hypothetical protein